MSDLANKKCIPCEGNIPPFDFEEIHNYLKQVDGWEVVEDKIDGFHLIKNFKFDNDLTCHITYFRDFVELPEPARRYMNIKAARIFVDRLIGDDGLRTYTGQDEARARSILMETDLSNADHNVLTGDPNLNNAIDTFTPADVLNR